MAVLLPAIVRLPRFSMPPPPALVLLSTTVLLVSAIVEVCGTDSTRIVDGATLQSLDIDSIDLIEIATVLELEHGIVVEVEDFDGVVTFGDALAVFEGLQGRPPGDAHHQ